MRQPSSRPAAPRKRKSHKHRHCPQWTIAESALIPSDQWLAGLSCETTGIDQWLYPAKRRRKLYPTLRVGREALTQSWTMEPVWRWLQRLRELPEHVLDQMVAPS